MSSLNDDVIPGLDMVGVLPSNGRGQSINTPGSGRGQSDRVFVCGRGRPVYPVELSQCTVNQSVLGAARPVVTSTPITHQNAVPQPIQSEDLGSLITDLAKQIGEAITSSLHSMHHSNQPQGPAPQSQYVQPQCVSGCADMSNMKIVVQSGTKPPPYFRGDSTDSFSIHEWEDMMQVYMNRMGAKTDSEMYDLVMGRLTGKAKDIVKVSLRSQPELLTSITPATVFDILKRNFSELTYSSIPMADFYATVPKAGEGAMDYWVRLNKAIDVADECLRRRGRSVDDSSAEVVMMFISHCPDSNLAMSFRLKPVEQWTAAEVQERLDGHQRDLRRSSTRAQQVSKISACSQSPLAGAPPLSYVPCEPQQSPAVIQAAHSPSFDPSHGHLGEPQTFSAATPSVSPSSHASIPPTPSPSQSSTPVDPGLVGLLDRVLSLCSASLAPAAQAQPNQQFHSRNRPRANQQFHARNQRSSGQQFRQRGPCGVCQDSNHGTMEHCRLHQLCRRCFQPGHFANQCPSISQPSDVSASSPNNRAQAHHANANPF